MAIEEPSESEPDRCLRTVRIVSPSLNYGEKVSPPVRTHSGCELSAGLRLS